MKIERNCRDLIHQAHLLIICRCLIYQAHLFFCRGLIHQTLLMKIERNCRDLIHQTKIMSSRIDKI